MKILITGAKGFLGKNLVHALNNAGYNDISEYTLDSSGDDLKRYCGECGFVFHLAGVNRPKDVSEFMTGNAGFTEQVLHCLSDAGNTVPLVLSSSIQAGLNNDYGISKRAAENAVFEYGKENDVPVYVYRFPNLFGRWSMPNYNTVIATFCHNIARGLPIRIDDREKTLPLAYVDDVTGQFIRILETGIKLPPGEFVVFPPSLIYERKLGCIADTIERFRDSLFSGKEPEIKDEFEAKLYDTYRSFIPEN
ncbi:MAG: NAD-dependent epimerase/dehydratase family protein [Lachnospiraceae bacterium]|nr:NAD-dependent epimerase/dehydratase family protein [Lachnospiraceae bacterium]